ncbi:MBL fold metallo-hydrolase [Yersinia mollaretii]|uniref:Metallo-beta-lactamase family protein n=1 Tax=Yersinia mollaretii TaxID=33060 RepID=A0AA36LPN7_YERMO|nr:MBL fold metallo-hydrolase [Yersinia mollaretii]MDA5527865.1 MBL fold metallo-hydrolase [Yersinia mollaretii]MDR7875571.1 MBL fold metallo-hydrolase [Yersinia mollaretii]WQC74580.1 MBL fold metallo-hydrolase [Yersinia mollaretii]CNF09214.1 metallo-beta-lactamase family protein [Yersinia mollaretii]CNI19345.1 metallo-beta-lactamase family protein [Yersinia mollaretii]
MTTNIDVPHTATPDSSLSWKHFPAGKDGFYRSPVLITGAREAVLIDGGFTLSDGRYLLEAIKETGKKLTTIYISQSDPDYYFSLAPIKTAFPDVRVIAAPETIDAIKKSVDKKIEAWGTQLKDNGPQSFADIVMPEPFDDPEINLEGHSLKIINAIGLANRRYIWVPALSSIFGGVLLFSGTHVWTADTVGAEARACWLKNLESMASYKPTVVIAGHMEPEAAIDYSAIIYTRDYLLAFEDELARASDSVELIIAMTRRYPDAGMEIALQIGAKVAKGEMSWG